MQQKQQPDGFLRINNMDKEELWSKVFIAVAGSDNVKDKSTCSSWADYAVEEFEKRFRTEQTKPEIPERLKLELVPFQEK